MTAGSVGPRPDFAEFFAYAYPAVLTQAIMLCGDRADAEDATQEAFVEAYRVWDRIAAYDVPEAWIRRVMVQRLWKVYRKRKTGQERLLQLPVPAQASPEQTAEAREVLRLLATLPPRQRITLALFCLEGWSQQEIAAALGMTRGGVAANVAKARQTLREALGMAADEATGREPLVAGMGTGWLGRFGAPRLGTGQDPLVGVLLDTQSWLRAAVEADPQLVERARTELAERLREGR
ncbi:sigma-70 family RNA polymerase sigma factor [Micromonospora zingiberis]|uniref:Sigma-70 family RNA polymerase sigma factor n=1 Tax=Micromonospora zingiberis TaxID=2053011 RepID=A0A4R0GJ86_9ACTN|nr:sigma-70 family RNA polymerase sigma factor [Micromonospora zingiberis]TCB96837.1 sigma-70 family RNA polymerase sigma factor [Micromonospora zingiberis]